MKANLLSITMRFYIIFSVSLGVEVMLGASFSWEI